MEATNRARAARRQMPEAQRRLWRLLRDRRFSGYKFRREHPVGGYFLDFYCAEAKISVEVDGRQHGFPWRRAHDITKEKYLLSRGIVTKRFWNWQIRREPESVKTTLRHLLQSRAPHPGNVAPQKRKSQDPLLSDCD